jgi:hypothetical protein
MGVMRVPAGGAVRAALTILFAVVALPAPALAAGTASLEGTTLVFRGTAGSDGAFARFYAAGSYASEDSYVFQGATSMKTYMRNLDVAVTAGDGCRQQQRDVVVCPASGVDHIEVDMGAGPDFFGAGGGDPLPASISVHGGPGKDSIFGDTKPPAGEQRLYGDGGDDSLTAFSRTLPIWMAGGAGNDNFTWEQTERGVATFADGGPGDDRFEAANIAGADTIVTGGGADWVNVHNDRTGDPDTVICGKDGLAQLLANPSDHTAGCKLDAFARTVRTLKPAIRRLERTAIGSSIRIKGLAVPRAGRIEAKLTANGYIAATARVTARHAGVVQLVLHVTAHGRSLLRARPLSLELALDYTPPGGRPRGATVDDRAVHTG